MLLLAAGCPSADERAELRRLDDWLVVLERARRGDLDEASPVPYWCDGWRGKAEQFRKLRGVGDRADRFAAACTHDAPAAWLRDDLARHRGAPLCALDRRALQNLPDERALADEVARRCATAGSPAPPSPLR
jgi:hypothetical protein